jgi:hypothetical protein
MEDTDQTPTTDAVTDPIIDKPTDAPTDSPDSTEPAAQVAPEYKPDYKLKVYDEEKELDDPFLKNLIKDADSEKKVKEIAQKYLGFDTVKQRHDKTKNDFGQYYQTTQPKAEVYDQYSKLQQKGDLEGIFEFLKIPDEAIFRYAVQKAEQANLSPEQRQAIQYQRQISNQKNYLEEQNQQLQQTQSQQLSQFRAQELNWVMARPEVSSVAQAFDTRNGKGSFQNLVRDKGLAHYAATNGREDLTAEQAVTEVIKLIGGFVTPTSQGAPTPGAPAGQALIQQNGAPPIIPNVTGRGTSPVKKQVRSIADLKQKAQEMSRSSSG